MENLIVKFLMNLSPGNNLRVQIELGFRLERLLLNLLSQRLNKFNVVKEFSKSLKATEASHGCFLMKLIRLNNIQAS